MAINSTRIAPSFFSASALVATLLLLAACNSQSDIQGEYIGSQEECQTQSEAQLMAGMPSNFELPDSQKSLRLVDLYSGCMNKQGWNIARPKKRVAAPVAAAASQKQVAPVPVQQAPQPQPLKAAAVPQPQPQPKPAPVPVQTQPSALQPSPSTPALNTVVPNAATYQPAGGVGGAGATYGTGPGREF